MITKNTLSGKNGAINWAQNQGNYFTIHSVLTAGNYDYLTISVTCAIAISPLLTTSPTDLGGSRLNQYLWVEVPTTLGVYPNGVTELLGLDTDNMVNMLGNYPVYVCQDACLGLNVTGMVCNGPRAMVGWNGNPNLWAAVRPIGGLVTDFGLPANGTDYNPGIGPPKSFFVKWFNRASSSSPCSTTSSYYFQWIALKNGEWVPVDDLTPQAQLVSQTAINDKLLQNAWSETAGYAFNDNNGTLHLRALYPGGGLRPAQNSDGSIDFATARTDQGLDGYFKLVTWPVTNPSGTCISTTISPGQSFSPRDIFNPLYGQAQPGISTSMTQSQIATLVNKGWVIDTVFNQYGLPVRPPVITTPVENAYVAQHPTIYGTGEPGATITLYAEDDGNPIDPNNPNNPDRAGREVGTAVVDSSGNWSIADNGNTKVTGSQRYHATQTVTIDSEPMTSEFSNIRTVLFTVPSDAPPVLSIDVPHTKNVNGGVLLGTDKVVIHGTASPNSAGETLKVHARHSSDSTFDEGDIISGCTVVLANAGTQNWTCEVDPAFFTDELASGEDYVFSAKLVNNAGGVDSGFSTGVPQTVDMTPPILAFDVTEPATTVSGTAHLDAAGTVPAANRPVHIKWPDGTTGQTTTGLDGSWSFTISTGMTSGEVKVYGIDPETNESDWIARHLTAPVRQLPMAGSHSRLIPAIVGIVAALLLTAAIICAVIGRKMRKGKAVADDP